MRREARKEMRNTREEGRKEGRKEESILLNEELESNEQFVFLYT